MDRLLSLLLAPLLLLPFTAHAAGLVNPDFDTGLSGWQLFGNCPAFYDDVVGSPQAGALGLNCLGDTALGSSATQCVALSNAAMLDFSARWAKNTDLPGANTVNLGYAVFAGTACDGAVLGSFHAELSRDVPGVACCGSGWQELSLPRQPVPAGAHSAVVHVFAGHGDALVFDHVVLTPTPIADPRALTGLWYDPNTSGQGIELHWVEPGRLVVLFYGHHDDGRNFFLIGTHDGPIAYGDAFTLPLTITRGGRFNHLDPALIVRETWGNVQLRFDSCSSAEAQLAGADGVQTLALVPLTRVPGLSCD